MRAETPGRVGSDGLQLRACRDSWVYITIMHVGKWRVVRILHVKFVSDMENGIPSQEGSDSWVDSNRQVVQKPHKPHAASHGFLALCKAAGRNSIERLCHSRTQLLAIVQSRTAFPCLSVSGRNFGDLVE
jgi:hypothetical protein